MHACMYVRVTGQHKRTILLLNVLPCIDIFEIIKNNNMEAQHQGLFITRVTGRGNGIFSLTREATIR